MTSEPMCTCWMVTTESGTRVPAGWVANHPEVRLVCRDGRVATGWTMGATWWNAQSGPMQLLEVEVDQPEHVVVTEDEIATLTPVGGYNDSTVFRKAVDDVLQKEAAAFLEDPDVGELALIVDAHTTLEVSVVVRRHGCSPGPPPS